MIIRYKGYDYKLLSQYELFWFAMLFLTLGWIIGNGWAGLTTVTAMVFPDPYLWWVEL
jgi:hypothetical protein